MAAGRALLCSVVVLIGALANWLGCAPNAHLVPRLLPMLVWSLSVPERMHAPWPAADWALLSKQDHAGAVALFKLASLAPRALLSAPREVNGPCGGCATHQGAGGTSGSASPFAGDGSGCAAAFEHLASALHPIAARVRAIPGESREAEGCPAAPGEVSRETLSPASSLLLLKALAAAAAAETPPQALRVVSALLGPLLSRLAAVAGLLLARAGEAAPGGPSGATWGLGAVPAGPMDTAGVLGAAPVEVLAEAAGRELEALAAVLGAWPASLRAEGASALSPHVPTLARLFGGPPLAPHGAADRLAGAACAAAAAMFDGFGSHAAPLLAELAPALASRFDRATAAAADAHARSPCHRDVGADIASAATGRSTVLHVLRSAAWSCCDAGAGPAELSAALLRHVAEQCTAPVLSLTPAAAAAEQAVRAEWFDLCAACASSAEASRLLGPSAGLVVDACISVATSRPPGVPAAGGSDESISPEAIFGLKQALLLLQAAVPPAPLGQMLHLALQEPCSPVVGGRVILLPLPCSRSGALLCALLVCLSTWAPSWLLGDAASALWSMRNGHGTGVFARWLDEALAPDGLPRPSLSADAKAAFAKQLLEATNWSAFKAALKQLAGGKKKQS